MLESDLEDIEITLTVGVITKDRPEYLFRCLQSIRAQNIPHISILVSDDSEIYIERNRDTCDLFCASYLPGPCRGLYANRNNVFNSVSSSHLLTCDDDHVYPPNFLLDLLDFIHIHPNDILVVSELSCLDEPDLVLRAPRYINTNGAITCHNQIVSLDSIACGSTVYPSSFLQLKIRCDENYKFGRFWYLFGLSIRKKSSFLIRLVPHISITHQSDSSTGRLANHSFVIHQIEADLYVSLVHFLYFSPNIMTFLRIIWKSFVVISIGRQIHGSNARHTLSLRHIFSALKKAFDARAFYCG